MINETMRAWGANRCLIRDLAEYGAQRAAVVGKENVFDYTIGNPSVPAPKAVDDAIREIMAEMPSLELHSYTPAKGLLETREAIAADLNARFGAGAGAEDLFICSGASQELAALCRALYFPGCEILAIAPYFPEYKVFAEAAGAEFKVVPPDLPGFQISLEAVEATLSEKTAAILVNSPNNPAGTVYTRQTLEGLGALLEKKSRELGRPIYVIADEPYRELVYGVETPFMPLIYPNTVVCYSYSKSLSLPGERIGYIYVPKAAADSESLMEAVAGAARAVGHICASSLMQRVIARCAHLMPDLTAYDQNRRLLYEGLTAMGYETARPDGAFYLFVKAPGGNANAFSRRAMEKDLLVVPGDDFGCPGYLRLCYCLPEEKLLRSLPIFRELIEE